jgi:hypothetical protein
VDQKHAYASIVGVSVIILCLDVIAHATVMIHKPIIGLLFAQKAKMKFMTHLSKSGHNHTRIVSIATIRKDSARKHIALAETNKQG